ncbi:MAG: hypothetical protein SVR04_07410 [Spirochaetota bacterium]|nr:hypothetical protein [Spirochaetota bacterium]
MKPARRLQYLRQNTVTGEAPVDPGYTRRKINYNPVEFTGAVGLPRRPSEYRRGPRVIVIEGVDHADPVAGILQPAGDPHESVGFEVQIVQSEVVHRRLDTEDLRIHSFSRDTGQA